MNSVSNNFRKIISSSGVNSIFRIFGLGTSFLIVVLISRLFGVSNYGNYSLIFTLSQAIAMIFAMGIPNALILLVGNQNLNATESKALLFKGIKITLFLALIPVFVFYFGSKILAECFGNIELDSFFSVVSFAIPFFIAHELFLYYFISVKNFLFYNIFMFVLPNVFLGIFLAIFYLFGKENHFTILSFALAIFLVVLIEIMVTYEKNIPYQASIISTKMLLKTASPMLFSGLMLYLLNWTDVIMLGLMVEEKEVGIYNIAYKIGSVGFLVIVSVSTIVTPRMAELFGKGDLLGLKKMTHKATQLIAVLSIPLVVILILFRTFILSFFGNEALLGQSTLIIVTLGVLFSAIAGNVDQILNMTNNQIVLRNITIICFLLNVLLNFFLIPIYGINGAAFASLVSNITINLLCVFYIKKKLGFYTLF